MVLFIFSAVIVLALVYVFALFHYCTREDIKPLGFVERWAERKMQK